MRANHDPNCPEGRRLARSSRRLIRTADGSHSLADDAVGDGFHSRHGALTESRHVYLQAGLEHAAGIFPDPLVVLEVGLGAGLNALLAADFARRTRRILRYVALEPFPVGEELAGRLAFPGLTDRPGGRGMLRAILRTRPGRPAEPVPGMTLEVLDRRIEAFDPACCNLTGRAHVVFYDAFAPSRQPEAWTETALRAAGDALAPGGVLVTYCARGEVRRRLLGLGLETERLPGPPGKRHMTRAKRPGGNDVTITGGRGAGRNLSHPDSN